MLSTKMANLILDFVNQMGRLITIDDAKKMKPIPRRYNDKSKKTYAIETEGFIILVKVEKNDSNEPTVEFVKIIDW